MARERRIEYEDAIYHVMARGDWREDIVHDDKDRARFEDTLEEVVEKWLINVFQTIPSAVVAICLAKIPRGIRP